MPRITRDPTEDECPPYDNEDHAAVREMNIAGHQGPNPLSNAEVVENLRAAWQKTRDNKVARWNEQVIQDQEACEEEDRIQQDSEAQRCREQEKEEDDARREVEHKKSKINNSDLNLVVPGYISPRPSGYALDKVKNLQYVELDYFTVKGCREAQREREVTSNHDTLGLKAWPCSNPFRH